MKNNKETYIHYTGGVSNFLHVVTVFITAACSLILIFLVNAYLFNLTGSGAYTWQPLIDFINKPAAAFILGSKPLTAVLIIALILLMEANAWIYRKIAKKIFEHYAVVFIAAGGITLLIMMAASEKEIYFLSGCTLLFIGSIFFLIYGIKYHALNKRLMNSL